MLYILCAFDLILFCLGSMTSNDDADSTAEEKEKDVPGFEMTNMPLHLQLHHSFLQVWCNTVWKLVNLSKKVKRD